MYLYIVPHREECRKAVELVHKLGLDDIEVVDIIERRITSWNLATDLGTSLVPLLEAGEYIIAGYENVKSYLENLKSSRTESTNKAAGEL